MPVSLHGTQVRNWKTYADMANRPPVIIMFPAQKQNLRGYKFDDDREVEIV